MTRRVAIIGAGIGAQHLDAYLGLPNRFDVACLCDIDRARAENVALPHGLRCETDFATVLADKSIDIIDICLPPHLHLQACLSALDAGRVVICEKPLVTSLADADLLAEKASLTGGAIYPVFQYRYGLGMSQLKALIAEGLAGRCYAGSLETHWDRDVSYYDVAWRGTWRGEQGGALLGHAIHAHDLLASILGPVACVYAVAATRVNAIEVEDCAALSIRMASGALVTSSVTLGAADNSSRIRLAFEGFTVESDHAPYSPAAEAWRFTARAPTLQPQIDSVLAGIGPVSVGFAGLLEAIADHLDGQPSLPVLLEDGRRSIEFVTAAYHSIRSGQPVSLPLTSDHPLYGGWIPHGT